MKLDTGRISLKAVLVLIILALFAIFLFQNSAVVDIKFLLWKVSMSRVLLLIGSLAAGFLTGILLGWEFFGRKHR